MGGGVYLPQPETLRAIRAYVAEHHQELRRILANRTLRRLLGELEDARAARVPKGFACDHPAADLLRYKSYIIYTSLRWNLPPRPPSTRRS